MKRLLLATALLEAVAGLFLLAAPTDFAQFLFGVPLDSAASLTVARIGGTGLLSLGVAAWFASFDTQSGAARGLVSAMVVYNAGAAILLGAATSQPGAVIPILWAGAGLHAAMATWCIFILRKTKHS